MPRRLAAYCPLLSTWWPFLGGLCCFGVWCALSLFAGRCGCEPKTNDSAAADDDEDVACGAAAVLSARGYQVETAFDGRQVLDRMALDPLPDLVVLDFAMPEFAGEAVMRRLRADPRTEGVPLLLATASDIDLSTIQKASGMLRKPYARRVLYGMIDRLLSDAASQP